MVAVKGFLHGSWMVRMFYSWIFGSLRRVGMTLSLDPLILYCSMLNEFCVIDLLFLCLSVGCDVFLFVSGLYWLRLLLLMVLVSSLAFGSLLPLVCLVRHCP